MAREPAARNPKTPAKAVRKNASARGARSPKATPSSEPSRARATKKKKPERPAKAKSAKKITADQATPAAEALPPPPPPRRGRPKNSPDVWTPEHIEEVAATLWNYILDTDCPTEAEFCFKHGVAFQRLSEFPVLRELKEFLFAKRQSYTVRQGISLGQFGGPRGAFLARLAANAGPYSMLEKSQVDNTVHVDDSILTLTPEERAVRLAELLRKAQG